MTENGNGGGRLSPRGDDKFADQSEEFARTILEIDARMEPTEQKAQRLGEFYTALPKRAQLQLFVQLSATMFELSLLLRKLGG